MCVPIFPSTQLPRLMLICPDVVKIHMMWLNTHDVLCQELVLIFYSDWETTLKAALNEPDGLLFKQVK